MKDKPDEIQRKKVTVKVQLLKGYPTPSSLSEYLAQLAHHYENNDGPPEFLKMQTDRPGLTGTLGEIKEYK